MINRINRVVSGLNILTSTSPYFQSCFSTPWKNPVSDASNQEIAGNLEKTFEPHTGILYQKKISEPCA